MGRWMGVGVSHGSPSFRQRSLANGRHNDEAAAGERRCCAVALFSPFIFFSLGHPAPIHSGLQVDLLFVVDSSAGAIIPFHWLVIRIKRGDGKRRTAGLLCMPCPYDSGKLVAGPESCSASIISLSLLTRVQSTGSWCIIWFLSRADTIPLISTYIFSWPFFFIFFFWGGTQDSRASSEMKKSSSCRGMPCPQHCSTYSPLLHHGKGRRKAEEKKKTNQSARPEANCFPILKGATAISKEINK